MRVSVITTPVDSPCAICKGGPGSIITIITLTTSGQTLPICPVCFSGEHTLDIQTDELSPGPTPRRKKLKQTKKVSIAQELEVAELLGGRTQPASGAMSGAKGDIRKKGKLRIEAKFTAAESYRLELEDLQKIGSECGPGELPALVLDFVKPGTNALRQRFAVLTFEDFQELLSRKKT